MGALRGPGIHGWAVVRIECVVGVNSPPSDERVQGEDDRGGEWETTKVSPSREHGDVYYGTKKRSFQTMAQWSWDSSRFEVCMSGGEMSRSLADVYKRLEGAKPGTLARLRVGVASARGISKRRGAGTPFLREGLGTQRGLTARQLRVLEVHSRAEHSRCCTHITRSASCLPLPVLYISCLSMHVHSLSISLAAHDL